ncbi:MAG: ABC transporter substrate-binding protein [Erysipelotrichaceae bacterium]|jgi:oligopeptide transport system substrate-binding protein|nr:ABC transporter substrate-binding protein [Erysipelotrichaceae bacterium]
MKTSFTKILTLCLTTGALLLTGGCSCGPVDPNAKRIFDALGDDYLADPDNEYLPTLGTSVMASNTYHTAIAAIPSTFNYHVVSEADTARHVANFVDGLLTHDSYGRLVRNLAETAKRNDDNTVFTFTVRQNVKWMTYEQKQYVAMINGVATPQFLTADDFVTTAKSVLDFTNASNLSFLITLVIQGAKEYYAYSYVRYMVATTPSWGAHRDDKPWLAAKMQEFIKKNFLVDVEIYPDDLDQIASFSRVGIKALDAKTIEYRTEMPAPFFPTMLTYSPFLPTNAAFLKDVTPKKFGVGYQNILYNGPFIHVARDPASNTMEYVNNREYWNPSVVHLEKVIYTILQSDATSETIRLMYENGEIDGYSLSSEDVDGWATHIYGPDGTGTIQNPADPVVYSRELNSVDATWHMAINPNRPNSIDGGTSVANQGATKDLTDALVSNANKALKIDKVRAAILDGIDLGKYNRSHGVSELEQTQHQLNTFVSPNFVLDEEGRDYIDFYYEEYGRNNGITAAEAKAKLSPGQYANVNLTTLQALALGNEARSAVDAYNTTFYPDQNDSNRITWPVVIENATLYQSQEQVSFDRLWIDKLNSTLNGCTIKDTVHAEFNEIPMCSDEVLATKRYPYFEVVMNEKLSNTDKFSSYVQAGYPNLVVWGWTPDYGDPLSYLNCYRTGGDMSFVANNQEPYAGYTVNGSTITRVENMFGVYDELVSQGAAESYSYTQRYSLFAKAEYELLNNLHLIKPLYSLGIGWRASIAKTVAYDSPTAAYGLAADRLVGLFVLEQVLTREERNAMYTIFTANKEAALEATGPINGIYN